LCVHALLMLLILWEAKETKHRHPTLKVFVPSLQTKHRHPTLKVFVPSLQTKHRHPTLKVFVPSLQTKHRHSTLKSVCTIITNKTQAPYPKSVCIIVTNNIIIIYSVLFQKQLENICHKRSNSYRDTMQFADKVTAPSMNKKPTRCTIVLKSLKLYCILIPLYMFRALLRPSAGCS
jgi:hypothetical protein